MVTLMRKGANVSIVILAGAFVLAGLSLAVRTIVRRRRSFDQRRLASLGTVESHRQARPHDGN